MTEDPDDRLWRDDVAKALAENRDIGWPAAMVCIAAMAFFGWLLWLVATH